MLEFTFMNFLNQIGVSEQGLIYSPIRDDLVAKISPLNTPCAHQPMLIDGDYPTSGRPGLEHEKFKQIDRINLNLKSELKRTQEFWLAV
jgi:hypothetical protein